MKIKTVKLDGINILKEKDFVNFNIKIVPDFVLKQLDLFTIHKNIEKTISQLADFLNYVNYKLKKENSSVIQIPQEKFSNYFAKNEITHFKQLLKALNILVAIPYEDKYYKNKHSTSATPAFYLRDEKLCMQYRISEQYLSETEYCLLFLKREKTKVIDINCELNETFKTTLLEEELDYIKVFKTELDYNKKEMKSTWSLYSRISRALSFDIKRFALQGETGNRIVSSLSLLSKETRTCLKTKYYDLDVSNSQPTFLAYYLKKNNYEIDNNYETVVSSGLFYEIFDELKLKRKETKKRCYRSIFFGWDETYLVNKIFKSNFPKVWNILKLIHSNKEENLAGKLQRIESELFNNLKLKYSTKYFTVYDSISFNNKKDLDLIIKQIEAYGKQIGLKINYKINS